MPVLLNRAARGIARRGAWCLLVAATCVLAAVGSAGAGSSADWNPSQLKSQVTKFTLPNGLRFVVMERHDTPVFSFMTHVNAGSVDEAAGETGLAHMFEHMAFKGTRSIGTKDYGKEKKLIEKVDALFLQLYAERDKGAAADPQRIAALQEQIVTAEKDADALVETNEFGQAIDRAGGVGLNASTAQDGTYYYYSLPSNRLEMWALLESDRFLDPIYRQYYKERDVVIEERRMRVDSQPFGQFIEEMQGVAFRAHPYKNSTIGHRSDLDNLTLEAAHRFYNTYYTPQNMVVAIVGDVYPADVKRLAEKYFSKMPRRADPPVVRTKEPEQKGQRRFVLPGDTQPIFGMGFHRPDQNHADDAPLSVLGSVLGDGRTSRLYKRMVKDEKSALAVGSFNGFPGSKYPTLFIVFAIPNSGFTPEQMETTSFEEIKKVQDDGITDEELTRIKTQNRAGFIRSLEGNQGLAGALAEFEILRGGWEKLFDEVARIESVTREQVQAAARTYLTAENATVGHMVTKGGDKTVAKSN